MKRRPLQYREASRGWCNHSMIFVLVLIAILGVVSCSKNDDSANAENQNSESTDTANASPSPGTTSPSPTETASPTTTASFAGTWVSKDPNTRGNTKFVITQDDADVKVHAWGKCTPTDCDWGEQAGGIIDNAAVVTWDQKFVIRKMRLTLEGNNELRVVTESVYNDNRPRRRSEEVFVKQS